jgi:hypothetical protein
MHFSIVNEVDFDVIVTKCALNLGLEITIFPPLPSPTRKDFKADCKFITSSSLFVFDKILESRA